MSGLDGDLVREGDRVLRHGDHLGEGFGVGGCGSSSDFSGLTGLRVGDHIFGQDLFEAGILVLGVLENVVLGAPGVANGSGVDVADLGELALLDAVAEVEEKGATERGSRRKTLVELDGVLSDHFKEMLLVSGLARNGSELAVEGGLEVFLDETWDLLFLSGDPQKAFVEIFEPSVLLSGLKGGVLLLSMAEDVVLLQEKVLSPLLSLLMPRAETSVAVCVFVAVNNRASLRTRRSSLRRLAGISRTLFGFHSRAI